MNNKLVIDTSVFISYSIYKKMYRIFDAIKTYHLMVYVNEELINEYFDNLRYINKYTPYELEDLMTAFTDLSIFVKVEKQFNQSPDPKDNFLFDIAIQTNSEVIVSQEKALLQFANTPVPVHDIKWFKETFPVPM